MTGAALRRHLHPGAWWTWAVGMAVAASMTTNPMVLAVALAVIVFVVVSRRDDTPWGRAFRYYLLLGAVIIVLRMVMHVLVGLKFGAFLVLPLPEVTLPSWAAGIQLFGDTYLEGLLGAALEGARLATMIVAVGAANALASPKRMLKVLPAALHEIGSAAVVAVTVAPQLTASIMRVRRARQLRGDTGGRFGAFRRIAMPILQDTLDRSLLLAAAMDGRGYGRRIETAPRRLPGALMLLGLLGACIGIYGLLDVASPPAIGLPVLVVGLVVGAVGVALAGRVVTRSTYRPDPWVLPEWATALSGVAAATAMILTVRTDPTSLGMPLAPALGLPATPLLPIVGLLVAALPAVVTPRPPPTARRGPRLAEERV